MIIIEYTDMEKRFNGKVTLEINDNVVKLYKNGIDKLSRKQKQSILEEFRGRPVIDFRKGSGGVLVMNDIVGLIGEGMDFIEFKRFLRETHTRCRSGEIREIGPDEFEMISASKGINIHMTFWNESKKYMAQGQGESLTIFCNYYLSTITRMKIGSSLSTEEVELPARALDETATDVVQESVTAEPAEGEGAFVEESQRLAATTPQPAVPDGYLKESVFVAFQTKANKDMEELKESMKELLKKIPCIAEIEERLERIESLQSEENAKQNGRILILEEAIEKLEKRLNGAEKEIRDEKSNRKRVSSELAAVKENIRVVHAEIPTDQSADLSGQITELKERIIQQGVDCENRAVRTERAASQARPIATNQSRQEISDPQPEPALSDANEVGEHAEVNNEAVDAVPHHDQITIDADVVILIDSNGKHIREDILDKGSSVAKILCYTVPDAIKIIENATFIKPPKKILFHIGTNDIELATPTTIAAKMDQLLHVTRSRLQHTQIFVSSVMQRRDLMDKVEELNSLYSDIVLKYYGTFLEHKYIKQNMLSDKKHLHPRGFYLLLAYFRFILFGTWPKANPRDRL